MSDLSSIAESLGTKLETLDLTADERNVLTSMLGGAEAPEVEGHGWDEGVAAFTFHGVKCDVHPWMAERAAGVQAAGVETVQGIFPSRS